MLAIGLMSGTSLDGVDAVLCEIEGAGLQTKVNQVAFATTPLPSPIKEKIKRCCALDHASSDLICSLNFELGEVFAQAVLSLCEQAGIQSSSLDFVASHGQTIYHIPKTQGELVASTLQIGESAVIAFRCHCPVVANFRVMDMAAQGEGAPLVPYSEYLLYREEHANIALQNIGGIGNVTYLPAKGGIDDLLAFDTGPGNMMIDAAAQLLFDLPYDDQGKLAAQGKVLPELAQELRAHPYLCKTPPKSTGREMFGIPYTKQLLQRYANASPYDLLATFTWFSAYCIGESYRQFLLPKGALQKVILAGGGAHNATLRSMIQKELPQSEVCIQEDLGYSSDAKEAIAFVILGNETLHGNFSNVPAATGARQKVILGNITPNPFAKGGAR